MVILEVPESVFTASPGYSKTAFLLDFAIWLYEKRRVSLARAARICGQTRFEFQKSLAQLNISLHFSAEDVEHDVAVLDNLFAA